MCIDFVDQDGIERRDRSYDHYTSLELRKTAMLEELEELSTSARSSRDEERFRELENELRTLGHVRRRRAHQIELDKLERENRILTRKFEKAKRQLEELQGSRPPEQTL